MSVRGYMKFTASLFNIPLEENFVVIKFIGENDIVEILHQTDYVKKRSSGKKDLWYKIVDCALYQRLCMHVVSKYSGQMSCDVCPFKDLNENQHKQFSFGYDFRDMMKKGKFIPLDTVKNVKVKENKKGKESEESTGMNESKGEQNDGVIYQIAYFTSPENMADNKINTQGFVIKGKNDEEAIQDFARHKQQVGVMENWVLYRREHTFVNGKKKVVITRVEEKENGQKVLQDNQMERPDSQIDGSGETGRTENSDQAN